MIRQRGIRIIGDWGTSRLRLSRIVAGKVVEEIEGPGIAALTEPPEQALRDAIAPWISDGMSISIALCGMVGSRNGWLEVDYVACPAVASAWQKGASQVSLDGAAVTIMAGLSCTNPAGAPDVMRGEETQVFGVLALEPRLTQGHHLIVLPGTHSKWVRIEDGCIAGFQTFPTGELFALLRDHSILTRAAQDGRKAGSANDEADGFNHGLIRASDGQLLGALFEARSAQLRLARSADWALGYLSGLLLGREVAEAAPGGHNRTVVVIGEPSLTDRYCAALRAAGIENEALDGAVCVRAGLLAAGNFDDN